MAGIVIGVQLPGLLALSYFTNSWPLSLAVIVLLSVPYLPLMAHPWRDRPQPFWARAALLTFFVWWAGCLAGWLLGPLVLVAARLMGLSAGVAVTAASVLSMAAGLRALWPHPRTVRRTIHVDNLPPAFDGYRIVHLSDIHCGPWTPAGRVRQWVARINDLEADLVAVTGDLITSGEAYVPAVSSALGDLRARDGVFACMGNHDYFTDGEAFAGVLRGAGLNLLRNAGQLVHRGDDSLYVSGVDDTWTRRNDMAAALAARPPGRFTLLLAHDPALFPEAARRGVDLTLSGHTHGGQVAIPGMARKVNLARLVTRFSMGLYRVGASALYVSRGAGTTGPPIRLGAPAEIAVLTLRLRSQQTAEGPGAVVRVAEAIRRDIHGVQDGDQHVVVGN